MTSLLADYLPLVIFIGVALVIGLALLLALGSALVAAISQRAFHSPSAGRYTEVGA